ncbi:MAG: acyltransferase family protein [Lachnospiraceae bacterium]|jgi:surface polysaccharide O-acyltransferase-like enzyme|nr:acyltransferase family protein [Lachnospiraceae bacterium]
MIKENRNNTIDFLKFFAMICVVWIHVEVPLVNKLNNTSVYLVRNALDWAVPYFFAASGFLLYNKRPEQVFKYALKIFSLYISSSVILYILRVIIIVINSIIYGKSIIHPIISYTKNINLTNLIKGNAISGQLWFLMSLVISSLIFGTLLYFFSYRLILILSIIFQSLSVIGIFNVSILQYAEGFTLGLVWLSLGAYIHSKDFMHLNKKLYCILPLVFVFYVFENTIINSNYDWVFLTFLTGMIIYICKIKNIKASYVTKLGALSIGPYILHLGVYSIITNINSWFSLGYKDTSISFILFAIFICILISYLIWTPLNKYLIKPIERCFFNFFDL